MAEIIRYVNTGSTPGGNGTTNATSGTDRAYASLAEWEAAEQTDLVSAGNTHLVYCSGSTADAICTVSGWTANATSYITIAQHPDDLPGGKWSDAVYRIYSNAWNAVLLTITVPYTRVTLIQGHHAGGGGSANGFVANLVGGVIFNGVILRRQTNTTGYALVVRGVSGSPAYVYNAITFGGWEAGIDVGSNGSYSSAVNCVSYGNTYNFRAFFEQTLINCLAAAPVSADFSRASTYSVTTVNCASSDGTADDFTATNCRVNQTFTFIDAANGDFHLDSADTGALGYGVGPGSDARVPTTDIDGDARSGSTCDIGADEYVSSGGQTGALTDTFSFSGSYAPIAHYSSGLTDSIGLGEGKTSLGNYLASLADSMALDGAYLPLAGYLAALSDSVGLDDARTPLLGLWAALSDSVTLGEASAALAKYRGSLVDSLTMADTVAGIAALIASLSDQVTLTGQESAATLSGGELSDTITLSDSTQAIAALFALLDESINLSDAVIGLLAAKASLSDILTVADDRGAIGSLIARLIDHFAFVDNVAGVPGEPGQSAAISDIIQLSDSLAVTGHYLVAINDSLSMVDAQTAIAKYLRTIADILQLSDVVAVETSGVTGPLTISVSVLRSTITYTVLRSSISSQVL